jgi:hypothetical protein
MLESAIAQNLGVSRNELRKHRDENPELSYKEGRLIHWTDEGMVWLHKWYGVDEKPSTSPDTFPATVFRSTFPNSKLIQVQANPRGINELLMVRVRDSQMFVPRMEIEIRQDGNGWAVIRQPRQRGKA